MTPAELLQLLRDIYQETLDLFKARQNTAQSVAEYDANNAYQQVIGRQEVHLQWLSDAIVALGGIVDEVTSQTDSKAWRSDDGKPIIEADARRQQQFLEKWGPRVEAVTNARQRKMLQLMLGEMKEHLRVLLQALEGRSDVLGRHSDGKILRGEVLPSRPKN